jgi:hypothetical protein
MRYEGQSLMRSSGMRYFAAIMGVALVAWVRHLFDPVLGEFHSFTFFFVAVILASSPLKFSRRLVVYRS